MSATLKFIQVNIERSKHLDLVIPFLKAQKPDAVALQEFMERDIERFKEELNMQVEFLPCCDHPGDGPPIDPPGIMGVGILSPHTLTLVGDEYYHGQRDPIIKHTQGVSGTTSNPLLVCEIEKAGELFKIATTHFTWTPKGEANDKQREDMKNLLKLLSKQGELILSGDFNAPRGGEMFSILAERYKDNVPPEYTTSIDGTIHRAGPIPFMVDGIFSTPGYKVSNVVMHTGVSDHCALSATISKN